LWKRARRCGAAGPVAVRHAARRPTGNLAGHHQANGPATSFALAGACCLWPRSTIGLVGCMPIKAERRLSAFGCRPSSPRRCSSLTQNPPVGASWSWTTWNGCKPYFTSRTKTCRRSRATLRHHRPDIPYSLVAPHITRPGPAGSALAIVWRVSRKDAPPASDKMLASSPRHAACWCRRFRGLILPDGKPNAGGPPSALEQEAAGRTQAAAAARETCCEPLRSGGGLTRMALSPGRPSTAAGLRRTNFGFWVCCPARHTGPCAMPGRPPRTAIRASGGGVSKPSNALCPRLLFLLYGGGVGGAASTVAGSTRYESGTRRVYVPGRRPHALQSSGARINSGPA
jgi:hypothetical protein